MSFRLLQRVGAVLVLTLAALLLGADAGEYPELSRAGLRALGRGVVPLMLLAGVNLAALDGRRPVRVLAVIVNVAALVASLLAVQRSAPPFVWMFLAVAVLLVLSSAMRVRELAHPSASGDDARAR